MDELIAGSGSGGYRNNDCLVGRTVILSHLLEQLSGLPRRTMERAINSAIYTGYTNQEDKRQKRYMTSVMPSI